MNQLLQYCISSLCFKRWLAPWLLTQPRCISVVYRGTFIAHISVVPLIYWQSDVSGKVPLWLALQKISYRSGFPRNCHRNTQNDAPKHRRNGRKEVRLRPFWTYKQGLFAFKFKFSASIYLWRCCMPFLFVHVLYTNPSLSFGMPALLSHLLLALRTTHVHTNHTSTTTTTTSVSNILSTVAAPSSLFLILHHQKHVRLFCVFVCVCWTYQGNVQRIRTTSQ